MEQKSNCGLDIGTSYLVVAREIVGTGEVQYTELRDAFFRITPPSPVSAKMIEKGLANQKYFRDSDGSFIVVGQDAIERAVERHGSARRPMHRGILSPKEPDARRVLKFLLKDLLGQPRSSGEKVVFSVPAQPINEEEEEFNGGYHEDAMKNDLNSFGFLPVPINEAEAICYSELDSSDYTGVAVSCLVPGTRIYTSKGIVPIEEVSIGDKVITHKGRWRRVTSKYSKEFAGPCTRVQISGFTNNPEDYQFVDNHELFIRKNSAWVWVGCEEVKEGDIVGEPVLSQDQELAEPTITLCERVTNSREYTKKHVTVTADVQRLLGYFLGDGSINRPGEWVQFDFANHEENNIRDVQEILRKNFGKESGLVKHGEGCTRIQCYSKGLFSWLSNHCYDENRQKCYPWDIQRISRADCLNLLIGLIRADGNISDEGVAFYNTNTKLVILAKQLFSRLGMAASITYREPREHALTDGRILTGKKQAWTVCSGSKFVLHGLKDLIENVSCETSKFAERLWIEDHFCCGRIQKVETTDYTGLVWDIEVEDDHSFSGPFLTIHNCGAGMSNLCVMSSGEAVMKFAVTGGGDWLDRMAAQSTGETDSVVQLEKEHGDFTVGVEHPTSRILSAIAAYYMRLIDYVVRCTEAKLGTAKALPRFSKSLPVIVAGGTSLARGFIPALENRLHQAKLPFQISEVRHAADPLHCVARGALLAASL